MAARSRAKLPLFVAGDAVMPADVCLLEPTRDDGTPDPEGVFLLVRCDADGRVELVR